MAFAPSPQRRASTEPPRHVASPIADTARSLVRRALAEQLANEGWHPDIQRCNAIRLICRIAHLNNHSLNFPRGWVREVMLALEERGQPTTAASVRWYRSNIGAGLIDPREHSVPEEICDWLEDVAFR